MAFQSASQTKRDVFFPSKRLIVQAFDLLLPSLEAHAIAPIERQGLDGINGEVGEWLKPPVC